MEEGYLAGEYPDGLTTLEGSPVEADIRIAWRSPDQGEGDGRIVARARSDVNGEWRVVGLDIESVYDVIGSLEGYDDKIVSMVKPVPVNFAFIVDELLPNAAFNGMDGKITIVGGFPPYTLSLIDEMPEGLSASLHRREITVSGTTSIGDGAYYIKAEVVSDNGVILEFEIPVYVGFNPPEGFSAENATLFRPTHFNYGANGLIRPTWLSKKVNEEDGSVFIKLSWVDVNGFGNGFRVYRSQQEMDPENLPTPLAELPPSTGKAPQPVDWTDDNVQEGETYYYIVSTFYGDEEKITHEMEVLASPAPSEIGEFFQGGFYVGNITVSGKTYAILMAPDEGESPSTLQWKTSNSSTEGTTSATDGWANTLAMTETEALRLSHPAAAYCRSYDGGGFDDWYLPSRNELALAWTYRSQLGELNLGKNTTYVWSSTQYDASSSWYRRFSDGYENSASKDSDRRVRPVRRLELVI